MNKNNTQQKLTDFSLSELVKELKSLDYLNEDEEINGGQNSPYEEITIKEIENYKKQIVSIIKERLSSIQNK